MASDSQTLLASARIKRGGALNVVPCIRSEIQKKGDWKRNFYEIFA